MYIYLGGPKPQNDEELGNRVGLIDKLVDEMGLSVFDPWGAWAGGAKPGPVVAIVNFKAVAACDVFIAYCPKNATGTAMEIGYASACSKPVVVWGDTDGAMFHYPGIVRVVNEEEALSALGGALAGPG